MHMRAVVFPPVAKMLSDSDRISIDVGGFMFHTNRSTLIGSSVYFRHMFSKDAWVEAKQSTLFLDRDSDVFRILLSIMRGGPACCQMLPRDDKSLCVRVLRDAEFFGIDSLLNEVKIVTQKHLHPHKAKKQRVKVFDKEHGGINEAIAAGILPDRIFSPPPPKFRVKQIIAASDGAELRFVDHNMDSEDLPAKRKIVCYALMEHVNGYQHIEPVIAKRPNGLHCDPSYNEDCSPLCDEQLLPCSTWKSRFEHKNDGLKISGWMVSPLGNDEAEDDKC